MDVFVHEFIEQYNVVDPPTHFRSAREFVDICVLEQRIEMLMDLARVLTTAPTDSVDSPEAWVKRAEPLLTHLENNLALIPSVDLAKLVFEVLHLRTISALPFKTPLSHRFRRVASMLASEQSTKDLKRIFQLYKSEDSYFELLAVLLHELILRGVQCEGIPLFEEQLLALKERDHPLAYLPGQLLDIEIGVEEYLPRYSLSSTSWARPYRDEWDEAETLDLDPTLKLEAQERTPEFDARLVHAVSLWESSQSENTEIGCYQSNLVLSKAAITPELLQSIPLKSFDMAAVKLQALEAHQVFALLFGAASQTGSNSQSFMGPYGRLAVWKSLAALVDCPDKAPMSDIEAQLSKCHCFELYAEVDYFEKAARSLSILCLRPDGRSLVFFVAQDGPAGLI
ncbi:MAG: DUF6183 family protein [Planctomycetota bacterium]|nr:DUF6183 family protein [Planctomycetota bacterium]